MILRLIFRRFAESIPVLVGVTLVVFLMIHLSGDPALIMLRPDTPPEQVDEFRRKLGLDDPLIVQYGRFLFRATRGDLGSSITYSRPSLELVLERFPATLELACTAMVLAILVGVPLGVFAAASRGRVVDIASRLIVVAGQGIPTFWLGLMLIVLLAVEWRVLPSAGRGTLPHLVMPTLTLAAYLTATITRVTRSGVVQALESHYVRTARAKGLIEQRVLFHHALRNALIPLVTVVGLLIGQVLGGAVVTETIFAWPGVGRLIVEAVYQRDFPVVQAALLIVASVFVIVNLLVDLSYRIINPRLRDG